MKTIWVKNFFSTTYKFYQEGTPIGILSKRPLTNTYDAKIFDKKYTFLSNGIFKQDTKIIDRQKNTVIGNIVFNTWKNRATIIIDNNKFLWEFDNTWNTKWSLVNKQGERVSFTGSLGRGQIISNMENPIYFLCGLYVTYYKWQTATIIFVVLISVWVTLFS